MDNKYQRGKIYKLVSSQTDKIYIGSTIQTLKQRKSEHKYKYNPCRSRELTCYEDFNIILIKNYPCNSRKELQIEEGCIIKQNLDICLNYVIAGRTNIEWRVENKDILKQKQKIYKLENKDKIKEYNESRRDITNEYYRNKKWYCECCKITISRNGKKRHEGRKKHQSNSAL